MAGRLIGRDEKLAAIAAFFDGVERSPPQAADPPVKGAAASASRIPIDYEKP